MAGAVVPAVLWHNTTGECSRKKNDNGDDSKALGIQVTL